MKRFVAGDQNMALAYIASDEGKEEFERALASRGERWSREQVAGMMVIVDKMKGRSDDLGDRLEDKDEIKVEGKSFSEIVLFTMKYKAELR